MDLSYFNARIRGLRGRLLTQSDYAALMAVTDVEGIVEHLRQGDYATEIAVASARTEEDRYSVLSTALRARLATNFSLVWDIAPDAARPYLKSFLTAWEAHDLKAVIRGIARGVKREGLADVVVPAGEFNTASLNALVHARGVSEVTAYLESWGSGYAAPLRAGYKAYHKKQAIVDIEINIDIFASRLALESARGSGLNARTTREAVSMRIDAANILTILKTAGEGLSAEGLAGLFIEGGSIDHRLFLETAKIGSRVEAIVHLLERLRHGPIKEALSSADPDDALMLEESFDQAMEQHLRRVALVEPMSIALAASYLYLLVREIKNLRVIARGVEFGIPAYELKILMLNICPA
jgi:V/A-type H+-transporting ATPase subunit C